MSEIVRFRSSLRSSGRWLKQRMTADLPMDSTTRLPASRRACPACGAEVTRSGGGFCGNCGTPVAPEEPEPPALERPQIVDGALQGASMWKLTSTSPHASMAPPTPLTAAQIAVALRRGAWGAALAGALLCVGASSTWVALGGDDGWQVTVPSPSLSDYRVVALLAGLVALACAIRLAAVLRGDAARTSVTKTYNLGWLCVLVAAGDLIAGAVKVKGISNQVSDYSSAQDLDIFVYPSITYIVAIGGALALLVTLLQLPVVRIRELEEANAAEAASSGFEDCPSCGEQIRAKARLCRFCRYEVEAR